MRRAITTLNSVIEYTFFTPRIIDNLFIFIFFTSFILSPPYVGIADYIIW